MATITSNGELPTVIVKTLRSCMKSWQAGRGAIRRALTKCRKFIRDLGPITVKAQDVDTSIRKCANSACEHALVQTIKTAMGQKKVKESHASTTATTVSGTRYEIRSTFESHYTPSTISIVFMADSIPIEVEDAYGRLVLRRHQ